MDPKSSTPSAALISSVMNSFTALLTISVVLNIKVNQVPSTRVSLIFGSAFEFWLYNCYKDLQGCAKWFIGSVVGHNIKYLPKYGTSRNAPLKQPYEYKGEYWITLTPTSMKVGVHTKNSGPCNSAFS